MTTPTGSNVLADVISEKVNSSTPALASNEYVSSSSISPATICSPARRQSTSLISFPDTS